MSDVQRITPGPCGPLACPPPSAIECVVVDKVYDFCFEQFEVSNLVANDSTGSFPRFVSTVSCGIEPGATCQEAAPRLPLPGVPGLAEVGLFLTVPVVVTVTGSDSPGGLLTSVTQRTTAVGFRRVVLCAPEGTRVDCQVSGVCNCVPVTNPDGTLREVQCAAQLCLVTESTAPVKLLVPSYGFCTPAVCRLVPPPVPCVPTPANQGREFWLAYPANFHGGPADLYILADSLASFTVEIPALGFTTTGSAAPGAPATVEIPEGAAITTSETVEDKGIHVTADTPVTVIFRSPATPDASDDAYLGLPVSALGASTYVVPAFREDLSDRGPSGNLGPSQVTLVAAENATTVQVFTVCTGEDFTPPGRTVTLTLGQGQTWQYRCDNKGDTTGTRITADKPIAVFGGNACADVPPGVSACDYLVEQIFPLDFAGLDYYASPIQNGTTNLVRVLGTQDGTTVTLDDGVAPVTTIVNQSSVYDLLTALPVHVTSDKPVVVAQYGTGSSNPPFDRNRDPFFMLDLPTDAFLGSFRFFSPPGYSPNRINIVAPLGATVTLDLVPVAGFAPLPGGTHQWTSLEVAPGEHVVTGDRPVAVYVYGFTFGGSYGYPAGLGTIC